MPRPQAGVPGSNSAQVPQNTVAGADCGAMVALWRTLGAEVVLKGVALDGWR